MKEGVLAIYDLDIDYANHLMEYLNRKLDFQMEVRVFTKEETLREFCKNHVLDVLLLPEGLSRMKVERARIKTIIWLSEDNYKERDDEEYILYKFCKADNLVKQIYEILLQQESSGQRRQSLLTEKTEVMGVFSPYGGCKKTAFSLALGQVYTKEYPTLYLNMEMFPSVISEDEGSGSKGFSDLMYFIREKNKNISYKLQTLIVKKEGLDTIPPVRYYKDLLDLVPEDGRDLLEELRNSGHYEKIIIDVGYLGESTFSLLEACDRVYMPLPQNRQSEKKLNSLKKYLEWEGKKGLSESWILVDTTSMMDADNSAMKKFVQKVVENEGKEDHARIEQ